MSADQRAAMVVAGLFRTDSEQEAALRACVLDALARAREEGLREGLLKATSKCDDIAATHAEKARQARRKGHLDIAEQHRLEREGARACGTALRVLAEERS